MTFYAYVHCRPGAADSSGVFYVGKGKGARYRVLPKRNRYHGFIVDKHGADNIEVAKLECSSEQIAFDLEQGLIKCLKRSGVQLTNMTEGGEGSSGYVMSGEAKAKIAEHARLMAQDPEIQARRSAATKKHSTGYWADPENRAKTMAAMRGKKKTRSTASDEARRANAKKALTPEAMAKRSAACKARWADPVFREKMAEIRRKSWQDPVKREAMLANRPNRVGKSESNSED